MLPQMGAAVDDAIANGIGMSAAELLKLLRGVRECAGLRFVRGVFAMDSFARGIGDGKRAAGFADGVGGTAVEELR